MGSSAAGVGMLQRQRRDLTAQSVQLTEEEEEQQNKLLELLKKLQPGQKMEENDLKKLLTFAADISDNATKQKTQVVIDLLMADDEKAEVAALPKTEAELDAEMQVQKK